MRSLDLVDDIFVNTPWARPAHLLIASPRSRCKKPGCKNCSRDDLARRTPQYLNRQRGTISDIAPPLASEPGRALFFPVRTTLPAGLAENSRGPSRLMWEEIPEPALSAVEGAVRPGKARLALGAEAHGISGTLKGKTKRSCAPRTAGGGCPHINLPAFAVLLRRFWSALLFRRARLVRVRLRWGRGLGSAFPARLAAIPRLAVR